MHKKLKIEKPKNKKATDTILDTAMLSSFHTEIFGNRLICFDGCIAVCDYNEGYIKLKIDKGYLTLTGNKLDITLFEGQRLTVKGNISSLEFCTKE